MQEEAQEGGGERSGILEGGEEPSPSQEAPTDRKPEIIHQPIGGTIKGDILYHQVCVLANHTLTWWYNMSPLSKC